MRFNQFFYDELCESIYSMSKLSITKAEIEFLRRKCLYLPTEYIEFLGDYRFNPNEVKSTYGIFNDLNIIIDGFWQSSILWEVPLMSMISELYFKHVDTKWNMRGQGFKALRKGKMLSFANVSFADFGTRRRRSYRSQDTFVCNMRKWNFNNFIGTSNVHFAQKYGFTPIGTVAHEWFMAIAALFGVIGANKKALELWVETYSRQLSVALTDTFGSDIFFDEFSKVLAVIFDGLRQDSGDPIEFADKTIKFYSDNGIDPRTKKIVFSDSLDVRKAIKIARYCRDLIGCVFGIGTNLTNDFKNSKALNIVIKLIEIDGLNAIKISDDESKATGDAGTLVKALKEIHEQLRKND
jgi:nicotinate phosphoribosyltransferase